MKRIKNNKKMLKRLMKREREGILKEVEDKGGKNVVK
jgi:hypothetical protein